MDESKLKSKLKRVLGQGGLFGGGGSGFIQTSAAVGLGNSAMANQQQKYFDAVLKKMDLETKVVQKKFDKMEQSNKQGIAGKFGPQLTKIAGFTLGIAGIVQFRKALIDSSPLLQAVLKIMDTAFNLILRPFGDFIGAFLMPMAIGLLQHAIPFYTDMAKLLPDFIQAGKDFWSGDFAAILEPMSKAQEITNNHLDGILKKTGVPEHEAGFSLGDIIGPMVGPLLGPIVERFADQFQRDLTQGWLMFVDKWNMFWQKTLPDAFKGIEKAFYDAFNSLPREITQPILMFFGKLNLFFLKTLPEFFEGISDDALGWVSDRWEDFTQFFSILQSDVNGWVRDRWEALTGFFQYIKNSIDGLAIPVWDAIIRAFIGIRDKIQNLMDSILQIGVQVSGGDIDVSVPERYYSAWRERNYDLANLTPEEREQHFSNSTLLASGGIIPEHVVGRGTRSGRMYEFGEGGPERVTPISNNTQGGGGNVTINVYGVQNINDFESKVRPMVMKWLRDSKSNRGIL